MVDGRIEMRQRSFPTRAPAERSVQMEWEFALHQPGDQNAPSLAESVWHTGDIKSALAQLPLVVPTRVRREFERLLQPWPSGRYVDAYRRPGGILNLFTPVGTESQDEIWSHFMVEWKTATFPDERTRRAARLELEQRWNTTPQPFFAGLTPAQVMMGGGPREAKLAEEFLTQNDRTLAKQSFAGEGDALIKTLMLLRSWQVEPQLDGQTPRHIIVTERNELLAQREWALRSQSNQ